MRFFWPAILAATLCIHSAPVSAQAAYEPGYIIFAGGERVDGYVQNRDWVSSPLEVRFRKTLDAEPTTYTYRQLDEFKVGDHHFRRLIVRSDQTPIGWRRSVAPEDQVWVQREGLFRVLAEGPLTVYYLRHRGELFFIEIAGELVELRRHAFYATIRGETRTIVVDEFRDILVEQTRNCPDALRTVGNVDLTRRDLENYARRYNACVAPDRFRFVEIRYPLRLRPGLVVGLGFQTPIDDVASHRSPHQIVTFDSPRTQRARLGVAGLIELPGLYDRRAVELRAVADVYRWSTRDHARLWWCHSGTEFFGCPPDLPEGRYVSVLNSSNHTAVDLQLTAHARYAFTDGTLRPYGAIGLTAYLPVHSSFQGDVTETYTSLDYRDTWEDHSTQQMSSSRGRAFGPSASLGMRYRGLQLEINGQQVGQVLDPQQGYMLLHLMLSYYF
jgi:hypothetical protein